MKHLTLLLPLLSLAICSNAQVSYLNENFDQSCPTYTSFPVAWSVYNSILGTTPDGAWKCAPLNGRDNTPGMDCSGYFNNELNFDTSFLISPQLNLASYAGQHIYLHFDSKTSQINSGDRLSVLASNPTATTGPAGPETFVTYLDLTSDMSPVFGNNDSSNWVTHEVDLTQFETQGNFFIGFRYTSTDASGNIWFLDNISTSTSSLQVHNVGKSKLILNVLGVSTSTEITIGYSMPEAGIYSLSVFDMQGRQIYNENKSIQIGLTTYTINNLNLSKGLYLIKMGNADIYGTTKVVIP